MTHRFLAPALACLMALGVAMPRPAQANDGQTVVGVIAGIAALALIAKAIEDNRDDDAAQAQRGTRYYNIPNANRVNRNPHQPRSHNHARVVPDRCVRKIQTRAGDRRVFPRPCLRDNGVNIARLPSSCAFQVRTTRGLRTVYGARCLRQNGWRRQSVVANR